MAPRVLIAGFKHETNTFSKLPTDLEAYRVRGLYFGEDMRSAFEGTNTEIAGFLKACEAYGWEAALAAAGDATPSGLVTREAFETVSGHILQAIDEGGPPDAILLQLHGAMVAEHEDDGEGALLSLLRGQIGRDVPIGVTLDLHANVSGTMAALADVIVSYRTYPHIDQFDTATKCAGLIARMMEGEIHPKVTVARGAQLDGVDHGRTTAPGPMLSILEMADRLAREHGLLSVSINAGFPWADIADAGPSIVIVADGATEGAAVAADALKAEMWRSREIMTIDLVSAAEAVQKAREGGRTGAPFVIADYADNPGGGGYGDSTGLLREMLAVGLENAAISAFYDPENVAACREAGAGAEIELRLGGRLEPSLGAPVAAKGKVVGLYEGRFKLEGPMSTGVAINIGPVAVFKSGGVEVVLASRRGQNYDRQYFKAFGIEPTERSVLAVKSAQHFRADYAPIASGIAVVDDGAGITSHNYQSLNYSKVRRPIWPLDDFPD